MTLHRSQDADQNKAAGNGAGAKTIGKSPAGAEGARPQRFRSARFAWQFVRQPRETGAIAPSSARLARMMVTDMGLETARAVAEFGAGTGVFTRAILETVPERADLLAFEINPKLAAILAAEAPGAEVIVDSAANLASHLDRRGLSEVDAIVCGLPWAIFPESLQDELLAAASGCLAPGGRFATFAYLHACWFPAARRLKAKLLDAFSQVEASPVVWRNLPPAFVWRCVR